MEAPHPIRARRARSRAAIVGCGLVASFTLSPGRTLAAVTLSESDVTLALYDSADGTTWNTLSSSALTGVFGPHRCLCPDSLSVGVQLTSTGQTDLGTSTLTVSFLMGANCQSVPANCMSLGQASFTSTQTATAPYFSSSLVYESVAGSSTVNCASLTAGTTTLWAILAQDGTTLPFAPTIALPVVAGTVPAPTAVTAQPSNQGILVSWTAPTSTTLVAGYQVLCLPRPATAATAAYETCGLTSASSATSLAPADTTEICSAEIAADQTSVRLTGLDNGTLYTVGVIAIDPSGGVSSLSPLAQATPQDTLGFYDVYKSDGGAATACSLTSSSRTGRRSAVLGLALAAVAIVIAVRRRGSPGGRGPAALLSLLVLAFASEASGQDFSMDRSDDWARPARPRMFLSPEWGCEVGLSLYRPAIDSELGNGTHPYADTFGGSRHPLWEAEVVRYLKLGFGTWGLGLRAGYYKVTAAAFLGDGVTRSGDETGLRLIPFGLSLIYRANGIPGLAAVPMVPYAKAGLDGVFWTASNTGASASSTGFSPGWHMAGGLMIGLNALDTGELNPEGVAGPCAIFFEWDYAAINGLGLGKALRVGDNTWFAGLMFDL